MPVYSHPHRPVLCYSCGDALEWVYDPAVRDTCTRCGGKANGMDVAETRESVRQYGIERMREARQARFDYEDDEEAISAND